MGREDGEYPQPGREDCAARTDLQIGGKKMLLEAMFRGEFYPAETVIPREPTYRELQKASNDLLETLKVRLKGEDFQLVEQLLEQDLTSAAWSASATSATVFQQGCCSGRKPSWSSNPEGSHEGGSVFLEAAGDPDLAALLVISGG